MAGKKKKVKCNHRLAVEKEKMFFFQAQNVMKTSEILFCVILCLKKISFPGEKGQN